MDTNMPQKAQLTFGSAMRALLMLSLAITVLTSAPAYASKTVVNADGSTVLFNDDGSIRVYPDSPDAAADYLLNYAMMYSEAELEKSKLLIYDSDIQYIEKLIETSRDICSKKEITNCANTVKGYQDALLKLTNVQSRQTGNPPVSIDTSGVSSEVGEKTKPSAFSQLLIWAKKMSDLLMEVLAKLARGYI